METIKFDHLCMMAVHSGSVYSLEICVASGFADYLIVIKLNEHDYEVLEKDGERAAFLQAVFHHFFQLRDTALSETDQRRYLDIILHGTEPDVEAFLTEIDHGRANGAISNMVRITCGRDQSQLRQGHWFSGEQGVGVIHE
jgi:hypothetical protein